MPGVRLIIQAGCACDDACAAVYRVIGNFEMANNQLRSQLRKLHKWIFIYMGVFMLLWVISGIIISVPMAWMDVNTVGDKQAVDYGAATVSPAAAAARVIADNGPDTRISDLHTQKIQDRLLYVVKASGGKTSVIDAVSGEYFEFTAQLAEDIIRTRYAIDAPLIQNIKLEKHNFGYPWGPLPVSHLRFEGKHSDADFYVNHQSGGVRSGTPLTRARVAAGMIHSLEPVKFLTGSEMTHRVVLVLLGVVTLLGVIPGVYLTLPRRQRR